MERRPFWQASRQTKTGTECSKPERRRPETKNKNPLQKTGADRSRKLEHLRSRKLEHMASQSAPESGRRSLWQQTQASASKPSSARGNGRDATTGSEAAVPADDGLDLPASLRRCLHCNLPRNADLGVVMEDACGRCFHEACRALWRSRLSATGTANMVPCPLCRPWYCRRKNSHGIAGSRGTKRLDCCTPHGTLHISPASFCSGSIPGAVWTCS
jgi:hypothetical protein